MLVPRPSFTSSLMASLLPGSTAVNPFIRNFKPVSPLATWHAFDGWADVFVNTPNTGLQDLYVWAQMQLPWELPLKGMLHKSDAAAGGGCNHANEIDVSLSRKLGKHWTAMVKCAYYDAKNSFAAAGVTPVTSNSNVQKFWFQMNFSL